MSSLLARQNLKHKTMGNHRPATDSGEHRATEMESIWAPFQKEGEVTESRIVEATNAKKERKALHDITKQSGNTLDNHRGRLERMANDGSR